jgi:hypothetical protein
MVDRTLGLAVAGIEPGIFASAAAGAATFAGEIDSTAFLRPAQPAQAIVMAKAIDSDEFVIPCPQGWFASNPCRSGYLMAPDQALCCYRHSPPEVERSRLRWASGLRQYSP